MKTLSPPVRGIPGLMRSVAHVISTLIAVPYIALALYFLFVGYVASAKSLWALIESLVLVAYWFMPWGALALTLLLLTVAVLGVVAHTRSVGSAALFALSSASLVVFVRVRSDLPSLGEIIFMMPCLGVSLVSAWLMRPAGLPHPPDSACAGRAMPRI